ncbi:glycoside hydrolase family 43 C-terminal domain-containing protein [Deinococcus xianganensis]|uniref:Uncharacterized protein n=1 Tax=Deinococcus xianganensis TaxID=1507289 RepID=A0A6I4YGJ7_9DEIO|nr:glycoside hydrolase family 43 C-terminal domain-containing protein [Deinococcus xianganensis]MXV19958.1 hypothetical protein [Deinococcus xianganensis]
MNTFAPDRRRPARMLVGCYLLLAVSPFLPTMLFAVRGHPISWSTVLGEMNLAIPIMLSVFAAVLGANASVDSRPRPPGAWTAWPGCGQTLLLLTPVWTILLILGSLAVLRIWSVPTRAVVGTWETSSYNTTTLHDEHVARRVVLHADGTVTGEERGGWSAPRSLQGRYTYDQADRQLTLQVAGLEGEAQLMHDPFVDFRLTMRWAEDRALIQQLR